MVNDSPAFLSSIIRFRLYAKKERAIDSETRITFSSVEITGLKIAI
jgi:hypothetical protein